MTILKNIQPKEMFMGKLKHGGDLLEEIMDICRKYYVKIGRIEALGAVQKARLSFYNQKAHEYQFLVLDQHLEITNLTGNISLKRDIPVVHAHVTLADENGTAYGGHLAPGTIIFACELILQTFDGPKFMRAIDKITGLPLWNMEKNLKNNSR